MLLTADYRKSGDPQPTNSANTSEGEARQSAELEAQRQAETERTLKAEARPKAKFKAREQEAKGAAPSGSDPTLPSENRLGTIDRILEKLEFGNIAFNTSWLNEPPQHSGYSAHARGWQYHLTS